MNTPLFTVVIPTYNRANMVKKAIDSVMNQTYKGWKLLIIDDVSTDKTKKVVSPYLMIPHVHYHCMEKNGGISRVMNTALMMVDTPYLVQLDSDDWLPRTALSAIARRIYRDSGNTAMFYGNLRVWRIGKQKKSSKPGAKTYFHVRHKSFPNKYSFLKYNRWMVAPRCYRVDALREVGGWDTSDKYHGRIMEDRRIILRLIERYPIKWIDRTLYNRTKHIGQLTDRKTIRKRNYLRRKTFNFYLEKWGNKYKAKFGYNNGYLVIRKLKRRRKR
ncbi:glycosyltransferase family 2 protein [Brevibacillus fluminis]|uniref:Glycosyltransferase family 2 protein n=1 Tax=Brevibacillus fluminis TaxID=511487 RepID=A0A3M8CWM4_9BACL|nr:glycosyltransferase family A protein [Brevibacillus fluminis]RNB80093.1 glycosyltransferase family 2 protein [Brevibacillus fluminis]